MSSAPASEAVPQTKFVQQLEALQKLLLIAYAVSLPLSMTASWTLLTIGVLVWVADLFFLRRERSSVLPASAHPLILNLTLFAFTFAVFISGLFNGTAHAGELSASGLSEGLRSVWSLKAIISFFWGSHVVRRSPDCAATAVTLLLFVGAVAGCWGTIQQVFNIHPGYKYLQGTGFLGGPMAFAGQMQILGLLSLGLLLTKAYRSLGGTASSTVVFSIITIANLSGLVFAGERSAWLGGLAGALVLAALLSWRTFIRTMLILLVVGTLSYFTVPLVHTRVSAMFNAQQDVSTRVRWQIWNTALGEWKRSPIVGIGFLKFPHLDIPEAIVPGKSKDLNHAHSNYLHILATTGALGETMFACLYLACLWAAKRKFDNAGKSGELTERGLAAGTIAWLVSLMVSGIFEYNFGTAQVRLAQWFLLGLVLNARTAEQGSAATLANSD